MRSFSDFLYAQENEEIQITIKWLLIAYYVYRDNIGGIVFLDKFLPFNLDATNTEFKCRIFAR